MTNFEDLEKRNMEKFGKPPTEVKKKIEGTKGFIEFVSNIFDLYLGQIALTLVGFLKSIDETSSKDDEKE